MTTGRRAPRPEVTREGGILAALPQITGDVHPAADAADAAEMWPATEARTRYNPET